jgi:hypothetical protein
LSVTFTFEFFGAFQESFTVFAPIDVPLLGEEMITSSFETVATSVDEIVSSPTHIISSLIVSNTLIFCFPVLLNFTAFSNFTNH